MTQIAIANAVLCAGDFLRSQEKGPLTSKEYLKRWAVPQMAAVDGIDAVIGKHNLDALVAPTTDPAYPTDWSMGSLHGRRRVDYPAVAGYPHITVPAGDVFGLPVGVSFFGFAWSEPG